MTKRPQPVRAPRTEALRLNRSARGPAARFGVEAARAFGDAPGADASGGYQFFDIRAGARGTGGGGIGGRQGQVFETVTASFTLVFVNRHTASSFCSADQGQGFFIHHVTMTSGNRPFDARWVEKFDAPVRAERAKPLFQGFHRTGSLRASVPVDSRRLFSFCRASFRERQRYSASQI